MSSEPPLSAAREAAFSTALYEVYEPSVPTSTRGPELTGPPAKRRGPLPRRALIFSPSPRFPAATPPRKECDEAAEPPVPGDTGGSAARTVGPSAGRRRLGQVVDRNSAHRLGGEV